MVRPYFLLYLGTRRSSCARLCASLRRTLAHNDPTAPNCSFGFEDSVVMPGRMLTVSLLMYDAATQLAALSKQAGCGDIAFYNGLASGVSSGVDALYDTGGSGIFLASRSMSKRYLTCSEALTSSHLVYRRRKGVHPFRRFWPVSGRTALWLLAQLQQQFGKRVRRRHLPYPLLWRQCWGGGCPEAGILPKWRLLGYAAELVAPRISRGGFEVEATAIASAAVTSFNAGASWKR